MAARRKRRRGGGSCWQLPSGSWRAEVPVPGGVPLRKTFPREREAVAWMTATAAARDARTLVRPSAETVGDWVERWLGQKAGQVEPATHAFYESKARRHLLPELGKLRLTDLTPSRVADWYGTLTAAGVSAAEQRKAGRTLRTCLADAVRQQVLATNPAAAVKMPRSRPAEATALTLDQARRLLAAADPTPHAAVLRLGLDAGLRPQELFAVRWADVPPPCDVLTVRRAVEWVQGRPAREKEPKTAKGRRKVLLAPATAAALTALGPGEPVALVFPGRAGKWRNLRSFNDGPMSRLCRAADIPYVPVKVLRHTSASLLLQAGAPLKAVSERLGHEDPALTLRVYQHVLPDMQEAVRDVAAELFGSLTTPLTAGDSPAGESA